MADTSKMRRLANEQGEAARKHGQMATCPRCAHARTLFDRVGGYLCPKCGETIPDDEIAWVEATPIEAGGRAHVLQADADGHVSLVIDDAGAKTTMRMGLTEAWEVVGALIHGLTGHIMITSDGHMAMDHSALRGVYASRLWKTPASGQPFGLGTHNGCGGRLRVSQDDMSIECFRCGKKTQDA